VSRSAIRSIPAAAPAAKRRVAVKLAAAVALPLGVVVVWVVGNRMFDQATSMVFGQ
jgi:hypothetical protein